MTHPADDKCEAWHRKVGVGANSSPTPSTWSAFRAGWDANLQNAMLLEAIQCACDFGLLEEDEDSERGIEGIPGFEFKAKWGDMFQVQIEARLRDAIARAKGGPRESS